MMKMTCIVLLLLSIVICFVGADDFNLYGDAGQAYAIAVYIGSPPQKLNLIVDTGSTTLAVAAYPRQDGDKYFRFDNSSSLIGSEKQIQAKYSQSDWVGRLVSDLIQFPKLPNIPQVRSDIGLILKSHKFFVNGSDWQGLLGLAYLPVGARGDQIVVESWLDFVDRKLDKPTSFELELCGPQSVTNATHFGNFRVLKNDIQEYNNMFRTPILHKRWYEVAVMSIRVLHKSKVVTNAVDDEIKTVDVDMCLVLNQEKSIVDSGTTNIRLPDVMFRQIVDELKNAVQSSNILILDEFWYHAEAACWPEPQEWSLPWLAIDLLSAESNSQYFTLEIPPQNYMRVVSAYNSSSDSGTVSEFCYKLGLEAGGKETVLGYTAMEGLLVLFNRSAGWIGWQTSNCGPNALITGPYNTSRSIPAACDLITPISDMAISIKAAQWALAVISLVAAAVLIYLLAPCIKMLLLKPLPRSTQISMSQTALVGGDTA